MNWGGWLKSLVNLSLIKDDPLLDWNCPTCGVAVQDEVIDLDSDPEIFSPAPVDKKEMEEEKGLHMNDEIIVIDDSKNDINQVGYNHI